MNILGIRLNVGFDENELVKQYGARWSKEQKTWYLPFGLDKDYCTKLGNKYYEIQLLDVRRWFSAEALEGTGASSIERSGIKLNIIRQSDKHNAKQLGIRRKADQRYLPFYNTKLRRASVIRDLEYIIDWIPKEQLIYEGGKTERIFMEVRSGYPCFKCKKPMDILQPFPKPPKNLEHTYPGEYCDNTWDKPKSYAEFAERLGVHMDYRKTSMVDRPYAIHVCPHCGCVQGDYFIFEDKDCRLPVKIAFFAQHNVENDIWTIEE